MPDEPAVRLKPLVRFREFPFGTATDPSMRDAMAPRSEPGQAEAVDYLRSGVLLGVTMGADLTDWFDPGQKANPMIDGRPIGGTTEMTDGTWFWFAGLIHFVEKYNVRLPDEFLRFAARAGWRVRKDQVPSRRYECSYFAESLAPDEALTS